MGPFRILVTSTPTALCRELVRGHLYLAVAGERGGRVTPLTVDEVVGSGLTSLELTDLAMSELRRSTARADLRPVDTLPGLLFVVANDNLAASRMVLLPELIGPTAAGKPAGMHGGAPGTLPSGPGGCLGGLIGGLIAAVPSPDQLLCVPLRSARALDTLQVLASALGHALDAVAEPLSDQLFWYDGVRWIPLAVIHGDEEVTVLPTPAFVRTMNRLASMDLVRVAGEA